MSTNLREIKCPICGKIFVPAPYHAYRANHKDALVCSYHCVLESERRKDTKRKYIKRDKKGVKENEI
jgi:hypothetical protein